MLRHARACCALAAALSICAPARADEPPSADALFDEGAALLKAGKVEQACVELAASQQVEPAIGTLGLLAYCHEQSGKLATAMREYGEVAELAHLASQAEREKVARERVAELSARVVKLSIVLSEPADALEVYLDERRLSIDELAALPVDPGSVALRVSGRGLEPWRQTLSIPNDGSLLRVIVPPLQRAAAPAPTRARQAALPSAREDTWRRPALWASVGLGAVGVGVGVGSYFGLSALAARDEAAPHCHANRCDQTGVDARARAIGRARLSTLGFALGAVGLAAGGVLILTGRGEEPEQRTALSLSPDGAALSWERRF
jgi:hypothetical protein